MVIPKPISWQPDRDNPQTTKLFFRDRKSGEFYVVGSVAFPDAHFPGFALLSCQNLSDSQRKIWISEEQEYWTTDNWLKPDGNLKEVQGVKDGYWYGLTHFFNRMASEYGCTTWFFGGQSDDITRRNRMEVYRSKVLNKPVDLIEVPYVKEVANNLISEYVKLEKFAGDARSKLNQLMRSVDKDKNNGVLALKVLLAGYEHIPWRDTGTSYRPPIEILERVYA